MKKLLLIMVIPALFIVVSLAMSAFGYNISEGHYKIIAGCGLVLSAFVIASLIKEVLESLDSGEPFEFS